ncbi:MAG: potassium transporter TrkG [Coprococcus phoceensis]
MKIILFGYCAIICIGSILLALPISTRNPDAANLFTGFFTATSATCVTGLIQVDTYTHWSFFGQGVILCLIQIGGIGFMTLCISIMTLTKRKIGLVSRSLMQNSVSAPQIGGIVKMTRFIIIGTFSIEFLGAFYLPFTFVPSLGSQKESGSPFSTASPHFAMQDLI